MQTTDSPCSAGVLNVPPTAFSKAQDDDSPLLHGVCTCV
jgi:hypothetical protein